MNKQNLPQQKNHLFRRANGDYIFYGVNRGRLELFIGKADAMQQVRIPNVYNFGGKIADWVETQRGTLCIFGRWVWIADRQVDPGLTLIVRPESYLEELDPTHFTIDTSHATMTIKPKS